MRHPNYLGDWMMCSSWGILCGELCVCVFLVCDDKIIQYNLKENFTVGCRLQFVRQSSYQSRFEREVDVDKSKCNRASCQRIESKAYTHAHTHLGLLDLNTIAWKH